jgi:hypothetical protein
VIKGDLFTIGCLSNERVIDGHLEPCVRNKVYLAVSSEGVVFLWPGANPHGFRSAFIGLAVLPHLDV